MQKLKRGDCPTVLTKRQKSEARGRAAWRTLSLEEKKAIWVALEAMQGTRCAYCETDTTEGKRHIEHFRPLSQYPKQTFNWSNLFGSCERLDSCGTHKDAAKTAAYRPDDVIKPDDEDPDVFFVFSQDGVITPRDGLSKADCYRAKKTIEVFNLNCSGLRQAREGVLRGYLDTLEYFAGLKTSGDDSVWRDFYAQELATAATQPYSTAIRHILGGL